MFSKWCTPQAPARHQLCHGNGHHSTSTLDFESEGFQHSALYSTVFTNQQIFSTHKSLPPQLLQRPDITSERELIQYNINDRVYPIISLIQHHKLASLCS